MNVFTTKSFLSATGRAVHGLHDFLRGHAAQCVILLAFICLGVDAYRQNSFTAIALTLVFLPIKSVNNVIKKISNYVPLRYLQKAGQAKDFVAAFFVIGTFVLFFFLCLADKFVIPDALNEGIEKVVVSLDENIIQCLFFVGTTFISFMLLERRKWVPAKIMFALGFLWVAFQPPFSVLMKNLGIDSFSEAKAFDINEARFWFSTLNEAFKPNITIRAMIVYLAVSIVSFYFLRWVLYKNISTKKKYPHIKFSFAAVAIGCAIQLTTTETLALFLSNSESFLAVRRNFDNRSPMVQKSGGEINLIVYVGESTSTMNMGLYGYPRNTTPELTKMNIEDPNFILFQNVFSTHTHTTPSLLEAFSVGINREESFLPIDHRKRLSVVDILKQGGVNVGLISNQGMSGTWNQASAIIFKNADKTFSTETRLLGNKDYKSKKPWDDEFFGEHLGILAAGGRNSSTVTFLHSYAGHGDYRSNIPERYRIPVDDFYTTKSARRITESNLINLDQIEAYDSAIKYVDYSVARIIRVVKESKKPAILIYFSDHGDSVFTGRGHDSSRFTHEMARVPLIVYFNDVAKNENSELYKKYVALSKGGETSTLAQLSATILDLVGIQIEAKNAPEIDVRKIIGEKTLHSPIVVREIGDGITYMNLNAGKMSPPRNIAYRFSDATDAQTKDYVNARSDGNVVRALCKKKWPSFEQERRNQLIVDCSRFPPVKLATPW